MHSLLINAYNVHQGGGFTLLQALMCALPASLPTVAWVDARLPSLGALPAAVELRSVQPTLLSRIAAEREIAQRSARADHLLCFGNLPPLFKPACTASVLLQNRMLLEPHPLDGYGLQAQLRIQLERLWLFRRRGNASRFLVQTSTMRQMTLQRLGPQTHVEVVPFVDLAGMEAAGRAASDLGAGPGRTQPIFDFIYVASGEPHKNHRNLVEAWKLLAADGIRPSLALTLNSQVFAGLCDWIGQESAQHGLDIRIMGYLPAGRLEVAYRQSRALIYPSLLESFGLPLMEAARMGLPVLAGELDYVRDVVEPVQSFDPRSPVSISRAVRRQLQQLEEPTPLMSPHAFLEAVLGPQDPA